MSGTPSCGPGLWNCGDHSWRPTCTCAHPLNPCPTGGMNYHYHIHGPFRPDIHYTIHGRRNNT